MKLTSLRLANAIKCGKSMKDFITETDADMELIGVLVRVQPKGGGNQVYTSLYNTSYFHSDGDPTAYAKQGATAGKGVTALLGSSGPILEKTQAQAAAEVPPQVAEAARMPAKRGRPAKATV